MRIWKISHLYPGSSFVWKIRVVYFSVKHSYLCNNNKLSQFRESEQSVQGVNAQNIIMFTLIKININFFHHQKSEKLVRKRFLHLDGSILRQHYYTTVPYTSYENEGNIFKL